jgi:hypothetical protein
MQMLPCRDIMSIMYLQYSVVTNPASAHPPRTALAMTKMLPVLVALFSLLSVVLLYRAASESAVSLSPQGCRMSYMSPSYLVQSQFDASWTPLAKRYSLLLYREVGWEDNEVSRFHLYILFPREPSSPVVFQSFSSPEMRGRRTRSVR